MSEKRDLLSAEWAETSRRLQVSILKATSEIGWQQYDDAKVAKNSMPAAFESYQSFDVGILFQFIDMEGPDLICIKNMDYIPKCNKEIIFYFADCPILHALNDRGEKIWEGVLKPSDDDLLLQFAGKVFLVVIQKTTL